jgi:hypothetical protein
MISRRELIEAYGAWLQEWRWDFFGTLTFRGYPPASRAERIFAEWVAALEKLAGTRSFRYVRVTERGADDANLHFHVLVGGIKDQDRHFPFKWAERWRQLAGQAVVQRFDPNQGGVYYLLKTLLPDRDFAITFYFKEGADLSDDDTDYND